jgi:hypothetical protein
MLPALNDKNADIQSIAQKAMEDKNLLSELLNGLTSRKETFRYNCFKALMLISEERGQVLYPQWDYFVGHLSSDNTYRKISALQLMANLTKVDTEKRFEEAFDQYYALLDDKSMITAVYVARSSGRIVRAKPELEAEITDRLLSIDETHHESDRKDLIKSGAIEAFNEYLEAAKDKDRILEFVSGQLEGKSPKTRKLAKEFLKKWEK